MLRTFIQPEMLFLAGTMQALLPYVLWLYQGPNTSYDYDLSATPPMLWGVGCLSFWVGALCIRRTTQSPTTCFDSIRLNRLIWCTLAICGILIPQLAAMIAVFDGIPLFAFLDGTMDVLDTNTQLEDSSLGQVAILFATLYTLNACVMLLTIKALFVRNRLWLVGLIFFCILLETFGFTLGGKRQGLFMAVFFIFCGLSLHSLDPAGAVLRLLGLSQLPARKLIYLAAFLIGLAFFELLGSIRSGREVVFGAQETIRYLEIPLINFEYQCELAGVGPFKYEPWAVFRFLLPKRLALMFGDAFREIEFPPRLEPTSDAGFFGELHWRLGLWGVILGGLFAGTITRYWYDRSRRSVLCYLCYCQATWTLFSCHSYNHFLYIVFLPLPAAAFWLLCTFIRDYQAQPLGRLRVLQRGPLRIRTTHAPSP